MFLFKLLSFLALLKIHVLGLTFVGCEENIDVFQNHSRNDICVQTSISDTVKTHPCRLLPRWLTSDGIVYTAGDNDSGQLGRSGKRTKPFKIDSIEHLPVESVAAGNGFTVPLAKMNRKMNAMRLK